MSETLKDRKFKDAKFMRYAIPAFLLWLIGEYFFPVIATDQLNVLIPFFSSPPDAGGLGWTMEKITDPQAIGRVAWLIMPIIVGFLTIKLGPKFVFALYTTLYGVSELLIALHPSYEIYCIGMFMIPGIGIGVLMSTFSLIKNWFVDWRGTALGIVTFVSPIGNATSTQYLTAGWHNPSLGFTGTMTIISCIIIATGLLGFAIIRNTPKEIGCFPDGGTTPPPDENLVNADHIEKINPLHILKHKEAWFHMIMFGVCGMALVVYPGFFIPRFTELGFTPGQATAFTYGFSLCGGFLSLISGVIDDKLGTRKATICMFTLFLAGTITLRFGGIGNEWMIWFGMVALGGIVGAYPNLNPSLVAHIYGRKSFDRTFMWINTGVYILPGLGLGFTTRLASMDGGSFNLPYTVMIPIAVVALLCAIFTKKRVDLTADVEEARKKKGIQE